MTEYKFQGYYIPERMMGAIRRYVDEGIEPGHFLTAIICNDLREAVGRADTENMSNLPAYVGYFYNVAPAGCYGSHENMKNWMQMKRKAKNEKE